MASIGNLFASLDLKSANFESGLRRASTQTKRAQTEMTRQFSGMSSAARAAFTGMAAAAGAVGFGALLTKIGQVNMEYQKLQGMLVTATGSTKNAAMAMGMLQKFAATTPFSLDQVTQAYVRLKMIGLDPSERALKAYGNTSSAMGKDIMQYIEAVADATMGEMERLKEFNIKAKKNGDEVTMIFGDTKETIKNDAKSIEEYLIKLGETKFGTAMDLQAKTLGGALSNLGDKLAQMAVKFGEAGFAPALEQAIRGIEAGSGSLENFATQLGYLTGQVIGGAVQAMNFLVANMDAIRKAAEIAALVIGTKFAFALGATAVNAARTFVVANTAAIAGMLAYARVAPVMGTATMAMAGLRGVASGLMAMMGGPWGIALMAAGAGTYYLYQRITEARNGTQAFAEAMARTVPIKEKAAQAAMTLASATGSARAESLAYAKQLRAETQQLIINTKAKLQNAQAKIRELQAERASNMGKNSQSVRGAGGGIDPVISGRSFDDRRIRAEQNGAQALLSELNTYNQTLKEIDAQIAAAEAPISSPDVPSVAAPTTGGGGGAGGSQSRDQAREYLADLKFQGEQLARNAEDQAVWNNLRQAGVGIESEMGRQIVEQTRANQKREAYNDNQTALKDTRAEYARLREELGLSERQLALLNIERRTGNGLIEEGVIVVDAAAQAAKREAEAYFRDKEALEARNKALAESKRIREEQMEAMRRHAQDISRVREQIGLDFANIGIRAFDTLIRGSETFGKTFKTLLTDLGNLMLDVLVYEPLRTMMAEWAKTMSGALGNFLQSVAGNIIGSFSGGGAGGTGPSAGGTPNMDHVVYGKAMGGQLQGGNPYYVGERGAEMFVPDRSGYLVPNNRLGGGGTNLVVNVNGSTNPAETRKHVMEGIATALPMITDAAHAKTMSKLSRPRMN